MKSKKYECIKTYPVYYLFIEKEEVNRVKQRAALSSLSHESIFLGHDLKTLK